MTVAYCIDQAVLHIGEYLRSGRQGHWNVAELWMRRASLRIAAQ